MWLTLGELLYGCLETIWIYYRFSCYALFDGLGNYNNFKDIYNKLGVKNVSLYIFENLYKLPDI